MNYIHVSDSSLPDSIATVDMASVLGPVRDGVTQHHTLSPIPIHPNRFPAMRYRRFPAMHANFVLPYDYLFPRT